MSLHIGITREGLSRRYRLAARILHPDKHPGASADLLKYLINSMDIFQSACHEMLGRLNYAKKHGHERTLTMMMAQEVPESLQIWLAGRFQPHVITTNCSDLPTKFLFQNRSATSSTMTGPTHSFLRQPDS